MYLHGSVGVRARVYCLVCVVLFTFANPYVGQAGDFCVTVNTVGTSIVRLLLPLVLLLPFVLLLPLVLLMKQLGFGPTAQE